MKTFKNTRTNRRTAERMPIILRAGQDFFIEVAPYLGKWGVQVFKGETADRELVAEDFFPDRRLAESRARDFQTLLNKNPQELKNGLKI